MAKYIVASGCEAEIVEIVENIADDDIHAAVAFYKRLRDVFSLLSENPRIGRERNDISEGLRSFPVGAYLIFYRMRTREISIVRVIHGARELGQFFDV